MTKSEFLDQIKTAPVIAILRRPKVDLMTCVAALVDAGIRFIEATVDSPECLPFLESNAEKYEGALIGAGTVTTPELAGKAIAAGAKFLVTPNTNLEIIQIARAHGVLIFPGAMTPTEIFSAYQAGADAIKVFPAATLGSSYFKEIRGPFPQISLMATGGITVANAADFFAAGANAIGVGGSLALRDASPASIAACQAAARNLLGAANV
jgi:2-dehydro-3-deoxyphosphogluconate aldolase / (4S)-4-hydroxy-2-oxoglutarate aldolase